MFMFNLISQTQQHIRVYNLVKQELHKKLQANCKYISSIDIHPGGKFLVVNNLHLPLDTSSLKSCYDQLYVYFYLRNSLI